MFLRAPLGEEAELRLARSLRNERPGCRTPNSKLARAFLLCSILLIRPKWKLFFKEFQGTR